MSIRIALWIGGLLLAALPAWGAPPAITGDFCEVTSHSTIRCHWVTDIPSTTRIKFGTASGNYGSCPHTPGCWDRPSGNLRTHSFAISNLTPSTVYYLVACSNNGAEEACSSEKSLTTAALPNPYPGLPLPPDPVDTLAPSAGATLTVGADCLHPATGLQARINAAALGDTIVLPTTTVNCAGQFVFPNKTTGSGTITLRSDAANRPPEGVRDDPSRNGHSVITMSVINAQWAGAVTGNWNDLNDGNACKMSGVVKPGSYVFRQFVAEWSLRRCAFTATGAYVIAVSNASPIVVTTASPHGIGEDQTICVTGVGGNANANGCWIAKNVTATTAQLFRHDNSPRGGNGNYSGGGIVRGMVWRAVPTAYANSGRPAGVCVPDTWGHDTSAMYFDHGAYRCGMDQRWYRVQFWSSDSLTTPPGEGAPRNATFLFNTNAHHYKITGLKFVAPPFPVEEELLTGPRRRAGVELTAGSQIGGIAEFAQGTHHIWFDRIAMEIDPTQWAQHTAMGGVGPQPKPAHFQLTNSYLAGSSGWTRASHANFEIENQAIGLDLTGGTGPFLVHNNYLEIYGFCLYYQEHGGLGGMAGNITFTRNTCTKQPQYMDGHPQYAAAGHFQKWWGRQLFEFKEGSRALIQGNLFENNWVDQTRAAGALALGAQVGTNLVSWNNSTVNGFANWPRFSGIQVGDRVMDLNNANIHTVTDTSGLPSSFAVSGGPPSGTVSMCKVNGTNNGVRDLDIRSNVFRGSPIALVTFGGPYAGYYPSCYPVPHQRVRFDNNVVVLDASLISATGAGSPSAASPWLLSEGQEITYTHNSVYVASDDPTNGIHAIQLSEDDPAEQAWKFDGFVMRNNIFGFGTLSAIWRHGSTTGTAALNAQYPGGFTAAPNVFMRAGGNPGGYPSGNFFENSWNNVGYANPSNGDFNLRANSNNLSSGRRASDSRDMGANVQQLDRDRGAVYNVRHRDLTATSATVSFLTVDGAGCPVDYSTDAQFNGAVRVANPATGAVQDVPLTGLMPDTTYYYRVNCTNPLTGVFRTNAF